MFKKIITIVMGLLILGSVGCSTASTTDSAVMVKPHTENNLLDGLKIRGENIQRIDITKDSASICSTQPSKVSVSLDSIKQKMESQGQTNLLSEYDATRFMSPFGISPIQGVTYRQGLQYQDDEQKFWQEKSAGYGILERALTWCKDFAIWLFIGIVIIAVVLGVLYILPATRWIAVMVLKWIASIFPFIGSLVGWIFEKKATSQTVEIIQGGQKFLAALDAQPDPISKSVVKDLFLNSQSSAQSTNTKEFVKKVIK